MISIVNLEKPYIEAKGKYMVISPDRFPFWEEIDSMNRKYQLDYLLARGFDLT